MPRGRNKLIYNSFPGGIRKDLNPATIPDGAWASSKNVLCRHGRVVVRPGMSLERTLTAGNAVIGILLAGATSNGVIQLCYQTKTKTYTGGGVDITGTWTTSTTAFPVAFARFNSGGTLWVLRMNVINAMDKWDQNPANSFVDCTGAPSANCLTVIGPYVVTGGTTVAQIQWCEPNDIDNWPSSNILKMSEVESDGFLCSALVTLNSRSFVAFFQTGLYLCSLQAAKTPFSAQLVAKVPGPLHPTSAVVHEGVVYWLAWDYSIRAFDGSSVTVVASIQGLAGSPISSSIYYNNALPCWIFSGDEPEFWASLGDETNNFRDAICVNLKTKAVTYHVLGACITAGAAISWFSDDLGIMPAAYVGDTAGKIHVFSNYYKNDNGTDIPWEFEFGYRPLAEIGERAKLDAVASYFKKTVTSCSVRVEVATNDAIDDNNSYTYGTFDTSSGGNNLNAFRDESPKKWIKLRYSGTKNVTNLQYRGSIVSSWERSMV